MINDKNLNFLCRFGSKDTLHELLDSGGVDSYQIKSNPNLDHSHFDKMFDNPDHFSYRGIIKSKHLPSEYIDKLEDRIRNSRFSSQSTKDTDLQYLAEHPNLKDHHIDRLMRDSSWRVRCSIATRKDLKDHHVDHLVNDPQEDVRMNIAKNPNLKQHHIDKLIDDHSEEVRSELTENPNLKAHHIDKLIKDVDVNGFMNLAYHPNLEERHIHAFNDSVETSYRITKHPLYKKMKAEGKI